MIRNEVIVLFIADLLFLSLEIAKSSMMMICSCFVFPYVFVCVVRENERKRQIIGSKCE